MILKSYFQISTDQKKDFFYFCKEISLNSTELAAKNMWGNSNNTLTYLLNCTDRISPPNGDFYILYDKENIVACSGVYKTNFHSEIALAGVRTYVVNSHRHLSLNRDYLLIEQKKWCIKNGIKLIGLTFNEYNKNLIEVFKRKRLGEKVDRISTRSKEHLFYNGINVLDFPVKIQYTKQWIIYEKLDNNFDFDWSTIQWKDD